MTAATKAWLAWMTLMITIISSFAAFAQDSVSQTPLSQMGHSLQSGMVSPTAGLVSNIADIQRKPEEAKVLNNLQMLGKNGIWTNRLTGWSKHRASAFNAAAEFKDFSVFTDGTGVSTLLFQVGSKVQSYNISTATETDAITGLNATPIPCMRPYSPSISTTSPITVYCNGDIEPKEITATNTSSALEFNAGVWPGTFNSKTYSKPKFCEPFSDRMVYSGFTGAAVSFDILISDQGDAETFTLSAPVADTNAVAFTIPAILGPITGMHSLKTNSSAQVLVVGCKKGLAVISGDSASTFNLTVLTRSHGLVNNRTWVEVDSDLIYLSSDGIRSYTAAVLGDSLVSTALSYTINDQIKLIDLQNAQNAHATNNPLTQEVQWWVPYVGDGSQCKHALIMNYSGQGRSRQPIWSTKDGTSVACATVFDGVFYGGGYDGFLQQHYLTSTYNLVPINFTYTTPLISLNPMQKESLRKIVIITDGENQKFEVRPYIYVRLAGGATVRMSGQPASAILQAGVAGGTILGSWILGTGAFPSNFVKTLDFSSGGNGIFWEFEIKSSSADHVIDLAAIDFILSGGGIRR